VCGGQTNEQIDW